LFLLILFFKAITGTIFVMRDAKSGTTPTVSVMDKLIGVTTLESTFIV
jgi:hypothetical protein